MLQQQVVMFRGAYTYDDNVTGLRGFVCGDIDRRRVRERRDLSTSLA